MWKDFSSQCLYAGLLPSRIVSRLIHRGEERARERDFTSLLLTFSNLSRLLVLSPTTSEPTVFENYVHTLTLDGGPTIELSLWDTAGK